MDSKTTIPEGLKISDEFKKIIKDFILDLQTTFPEYRPFIQKWWKGKEVFSYIENEEEREYAFQESQEKSIQFIFSFCIRKFPPRFFDILYQNESIFSEDSGIDTEFLPHIHFKNIWNCDDISKKTRETIWKYFQLILFSITGSIENREAFGDSAKLFETINEEEFKSKLEETLEKMHDLFEDTSISTSFGSESGSGSSSDSKSGSGSTSGINMDNLPNAEKIHEHISGMLNGKLGQIAKEIAEETAQELNMDMENVTDMKDVFTKLFKNPTKLMGLVKNVGSKLDDKLKSGDLKESELMTEASEILNRMKNMPGMENLQDMLGKMGVGGGAKVDLNAMEAQLNRNIKKAELKERIKKKSEMKKVQKETKDVNALPNSNAMTDEEIISMFTSNPNLETGKPNMKTGSNIKSGKKGGDKKKK